MIMAVWKTPHCPNAATHCSAAKAAYDPANDDASTPRDIRNTADIMAGLRPRTLARVPKETVPNRTPAKNRLWIRGA